MNGRSKDEGLPGGFGNRGKFRGTGERIHNFAGNRRARSIIVNREHKKTNFRLFFEQGNKPICFRGTGTPREGLKDGIRRTPDHGYTISSVNMDPPV